MNSFDAENRYRIARAALEQLRASDAACSRCGRHALKRLITKRAHARMCLIYYVACGACGAMFRLPTTGAPPPRRTKECRPGPQAGIREERARAAGNSPSPQARRQALRCIPGGRQS